MVRKQIQSKPYAVEDFSFVGSGKSGKRNRVSEEHDKALSHAFAFDDDFRRAGFELI